MPPKCIPFDKSACDYFVSSYLSRQGWFLVDHFEFSNIIWCELQNLGEAKQVSAKKVQSLIWGTYSVVVYNGCCQTEGEYCEQTWEELNTWLTRRAERINPRSADPEVLAQETVAGLFSSLLQLTLEPRTFLAYALQCLKNKNRDLHRRTNAAKRSAENTLYLEEMNANPSPDQALHWEDKIESLEKSTAPTEMSIETREQRQQIQAFFRVHLRSELQILVAEAHFLAGFSPAEIADQLGKYPHEIRLVKARVVKKLRNLPPEEKQQFLDIVGANPGHDLDVKP